MPTLPIYIRVDDLDKWRALSNKSEFIHNALNSEHIPTEVLPSGVSIPAPRIFDKPIKGMDAVSKHPDVHYPTQPIKTPAQAKKAVEAIRKDNTTWTGPMWKKGKK